MDAARDALERALALGGPFEPVIRADLANLAGVPDRSPP
jgi:hypothetical protein